MDWARPAEALALDGTTRPDAPSLLANVQPVHNASPAPCGGLSPAKSPSTKAAIAASEGSAGRARNGCSTPVQTDQQPADGYDAPLAEAGSAGARTAIAPQPLAADYRSSAPGNARESSPQQPAGQDEGGPRGAEACAAVMVGGAVAGSGEGDGRGSEPLVAEASTGEPMDTSPSDRPSRPAATAAVAATVDQGEAAASAPALAPAVPMENLSNLPAFGAAPNAAVGAPPPEASEGAAHGSLEEAAAEKEDMPRPRKRRRTGSSNGAMMKELKGLLESSMYDIPSGRSRQASRAVSAPLPAVVAAAAAVRSALPTAAMAGQVPAEVIAAATAAFAAPPAPRVAALAAAAAVTSTLATGKRPAGRKSDAAARSTPSSSTAGAATAAIALLAVAADGADAPAAGAETGGAAGREGVANTDGQRRQRDSRSASARKVARNEAASGGNGGGTSGGKGASAAVGSSNKASTKSAIPAAAQAAGGSKPKPRGGAASGGASGAAAGSSAASGSATVRASRAKGGTGGWGSGGGSGPAAAAPTAPGASKASGASFAGTVVAGITPAAAAAASAAAADGRISLAGLGCGLNQYTYYPLRGSNIMTFYPGAIVVAHVGRLPSLRRPNDPAVPGVRLVRPAPLRRLTPEVLPPAEPPPRGRPLYLPGRRWPGGDTAAVVDGNDVYDLGIASTAVAAAEAAAGGCRDEASNPSGTSTYGKGSPAFIAERTSGGDDADADDGRLKQEEACTMAAATIGAEAVAEVCGLDAALVTGVAATREMPQELEAFQDMTERDDAYYQAIYDAEMADQGAVDAVSEEGEEVWVEDADEEDGEPDDENDIGVFRSLDEHRLLQRHLYGLLAAAPSGAVNGGGGVAAANGELVERGAGRGGVACGGALSTAGCSQVIPSFAFSRRLTAPRLYWGSQYQAQVPPPPPVASDAAAAALRRRPPSAAALARMGVPLHTAQPLSGAAAAAAARSDAQAAEAVCAARAALGYTAVPLPPPVTSAAGRPAAATAIPPGKMKTATSLPLSDQLHMKALKMELDEQKMNEPASSDAQMAEQGAAGSQERQGPLRQGDSSCAKVHAGPSSAGRDAEGQPQPQEQQRQEKQKQHLGQGQEQRQEHPMTTEGAAEAEPTGCTDQRKGLHADEVEAQGIGPSSAHVGKVDMQKQAQHQQQEKTATTTTTMKRQQVQTPQPEQAKRMHQEQDPKQGPQQQQHQQRPQEEESQAGAILFPADRGALGAEVRQQLAAAADMAARHAVMDAALRKVDGALGDMAQVLGVDSMGARVRGLWSAEAEAAFVGLIRQGETRLGHLIKSTHRPSLQHDAAGVVSYYYNVWKTRATADANAWHEERQQMKARGSGSPSASDTEGGGGGAAAGGGSAEPQRGAAAGKGKAVAAEDGGARRGGGRSGGKEKVKERQEGRNGVAQRGKVAGGGGGYRGGGRSGGGRATVGG